MRIVAGRWRGRLIKAPAGDAVRPTADKVREAWMSIISPKLPESKVLDLCAGSGALGIESLSRGASEATFVERNQGTIAIIRQNLKSLGAEDFATVIRGDAVKFVANIDAYSFDVAFADPPYADDTAVLLAQRWLEVPFSRILGIEHASAIRMPEGGDTRRYGTSSITFYK